MGDLDIDTRVHATGPSSFRATLSPEWEIWGPNGGYLAAVALRAAGAATGRARPVSLGAHFVGAGASREIDIDVVINRHTKVASSATATLTQDDRVVLVATVWGADGDLPGLVHHTDRSPLNGLTPPEDLQSAAELMAAVEGRTRHPFWSNIDHRPLDWVTDWASRGAQDPSTRAWYRFVPTDSFDDPWVDAARPLILVDLDSWPSATLAHVGDLEHYAPTIELAVRFVGSCSGSPWLYSAASAPVAAGGLIAASGEIWTRDGRLVALGGSTLLCRPSGRRPDR